MDKRKLINPDKTKDYTDMSGAKIIDARTPVVMNNENESYVKQKYLKKDLTKAMDFAKIPNHLIGMTESGHEVYFHHQKDKEAPTHEGKVEQMRFHEQKAFLAADKAAKYEALGLKGAAQYQRNVAKHHHKQAAVYSPVKLDRPQKAEMKPKPKLLYTGSNPKMKNLQKDVASSMKNAFGTPPPPPSPAPATPAPTGSSLGQNITGAINRSLGKNENIIKCLKKAKGWKVPGLVPEMEKSEDKIPMEEDNDSQMGYTHLMGALHHIKEILANFEPSQDLPDWVDYKIGQAYDNLSTVAHYLESNEQPPEESEELERSEHLKKADKPFKGYNAKKHSKTGGLNDKYRKKINRETGSDLKRPVTKKNVDPSSKEGKRRKSFCARMSGVKGPTSKDGKLTPKGAALRRWRCSKSLEKAMGDNWKVPGLVPEMEKARADEGKTLAQKVAARQERNVRTVKDTKTPTGQPTRTQRTHNVRAYQLEHGTNSGALLSEHKGIPERRPGEKIVGKPTTIEQGIGRDLRGQSAEERHGVHMHSGSMAGKKLPIGGGPESAAPVFATKDTKSYVIGGGYGDNKLTAKTRHEEVIRGIKNLQAKMTEKLPKSEKMEKARADEGKTLAQKVAARQERNVRTVKDTKTPTGQPTRTQRTHNVRAYQLEHGTNSGALLSEHKGIPERRPGEKIVGKPTTIEQGIGRDLRGQSAEERHGVHMHSGSMAGKKLPIGGGPESAAPVFATKDTKSYVIGGGYGDNKLTAKTRHEEVIRGIKNLQAKMTEKLPKSEKMEKEGGLLSSVADLASSAASGIKNAVSSIKNAVSGPGLGASINAQAAAGASPTPSQVASSYRAANKSN